MKLADILKEMIEKRKRSFYSDILYEKIQESFDFQNIQIGKIQKFNNNSYTFEVEIGNNTTDVYVDFIATKPEDLKLFPLLETATNIYNVAYSIGDEGITTQYQKTNLRDFLKILKTVIECAKDFVQRNNPDILTFFATGKKDKNQIDAQKMNVYRAICGKHLPSNYLIENTTSASGKDGFLAYNKDKFLKK